MKNMKLVRLENPFLMVGRLLPSTKIGKRDVCVAPPIFVFFFLSFFSFRVGGGRTQAMIIVANLKVEV